MPAFRKRPVIIEAEYFDGSADRAAEIVAWILAGGGQANAYPDHDDPDRWHIIIETLEGAMGAAPDTYVVRGVAGEFYACRGDVFLATYESVDQDMTVSV